jgi:GNAT superfamily N-acetyltransferase
VVGHSLADVHLLAVGICYALPDAERALASVPKVPELLIRRLTTEEVLERTARQEDWFFPGAVEESLERGDLCLGGYLGGGLVCSGWFATRPILALGGIVGFGPDCVWEHRLFTKLEFRGRGLNGALKPVALRHFAPQGFTTLLNTVDWTNDASRRLHVRLGYRRVATLLRVGSSRLGRTILVGGEEVGMHLKGPRG